MSRYIEEIQFFEQSTGRVQAVIVGRLTKVNEKTTHIEHDTTSPERGCGTVLITYRLLEGWGVRTRLAGSKGSFRQKYPGWDRRVGADRPRAYSGHQTNVVMQEPEGWHCG